MMKFASIVIFVVALLLGGAVAISQNTASASSSKFAEKVSTGESPQGAEVVANPCTNDLNLSYADGTLTLGIELGAMFRWRLKGKEQRAAPEEAYFRRSV